VCGIAGYFIKKPERVRPQAIQALAGNLLLKIETRGRDATGYAYVSRKETKPTFICKAPIAASDFLKIEGHLLTKPTVSAMPRSMLLHTRYATQGNPSDNRNNHPIYSKESGLCLVHNGWFIDDQLTVSEFGLKKDAEVDTETYLRLIEKFYLQGETKTVESGIQLATNNIYGSLACAMIQGGHPGCMWLWRDRGQLSLVLTDWGYVFASTKEAVLEALYASCRSIDLSWHEVLPVPSETLLVIKEDTREPEVVALESAPWDRAPSNINQKVIRYKVNGEEVIKRNRTSSYSGYYNHLYDEDWEGYYAGIENVDDRSSASTSTEAQQSRLPHISGGGTGASNNSPASGSNSGGQEGQHETSCFCGQCSKARDEAHKENRFCRWQYCGTCNSGKAKELVH
jgi:predicted glutamine amidotransferase